MSDTDDEKLSAYLKSLDLEDVLIVQPCGRYFGQSADVINADRGIVPDAFPQHNFIEGIVIGVVGTLGVFWARNLLLRSLHKA
jgi:hypothetical protein